MHDCIPLLKPDTPSEQARRVFGTLKGQILVSIATPDATRASIMGCSAPLTRMRLQRGQRKLYSPRLSLTQTLTLMFATVSSTSPHTQLACIADMSVPSRRSPVYGLHRQSHPRAATQMWQSRDCFPAGRPTVARLIGRLVLVTAAGDRGWGGARRSEAGGSGAGPIAARLRHGGVSCGDPRRCTSAGAAAHGRQSSPRQFQLPL